MGVYCFWSNYVSIFSLFILYRNYCDDIFYKAIKARYPDLILISTLGLGGQKRNEKVDMIDPHWYVAPEFFFGASRLFDTQDRGDYKIYVGEYAVNQNVEGGNLYGALAEAAFLTGIERNSDLVTMTSYAPLFENVNDRVWPVNMIWFDSHRVMGRSSYHVQKMYAENRPDYNVGVDFRQPEVKSVIKGQIGLGGWNTDNEFRDLKVTLADGTVIKPNMGEGWAHPATIVASVVAAITMFDAATVRRAAGLQARLLNEITRQLFHERKFPARPLKEMLGHTRVEVYGGMVTGIVVAIVVMNLWMMCFA